jgi:monofunctional biosynthetic peptidoglycan transglycosylase
LDVAPDGPAETSRRKAGPILRILSIATASACLPVVLFFATLPDVSALKTEFPKTTAFMERRKKELSRSGQSSRLEWIPVPVSRISRSLPLAVIAAEDARFYEHNGVDWEAVRGALDKDWESRNLRHGASTITQQLAKNLFLSPQRTPWRKLREWAIATRLEASLSKKRILELGAEAAARRYFGKSASSLSDFEAASLAAIIPSPRIYDPVRHPQRVARRARRILRWMGR